MTDEQQLLFGAGLGKVQRVTVEVFYPPILGNSEVTVSLQTTMRNKIARFRGYSQDHDHIFALIKEGKAIQDASVFCRAETVMAKMLSRVEALRQMGGIDVDTWHLRGIARK